MPVASNPVTSAGAPPAHSRAAVALAVSVAVACGGLVAFQARINGELGRQLDDGYVAAVFSFGGGLVLLAIAMAFSASGRRGFGRTVTALRTRSHPWWFFFGGAAGALLVLTQGLTAAVLGVALFTVAVVAGQTLTGLVIDRRGLGSLPAKPVTWARLVGAILMLAAVVLAVSAQLRGDIPVWMVVLPFLAGLGIGWQQAVNGQVRIITESVLTATFSNFVVGTAVLVIAMLVHSLFAGWPSTLPTDPWLYIGGPMGIVFIAGAAVIVRITGVLLLGLATTAGQLLASLALDLVAPVPGHELVATTVIGTALTLVAVVVTTLPSRRIATPAR